MINRSPKVFFLLLCIHVNCTAYSQVKDAGLWTSISLDKKITQSWQVSLSQEFRFNENITELGTFFSDLSATCRFNDAFRVSAAYRYVNKRKVSDYYSMRHRYYFDAAFRSKRDKLAAVIRFRFQSQYTDIFSSDDGKTPSCYLRPKISFRYDFDLPVKPYITAECFYSFSAKELDNARFALGVEKKIIYRLDADFFFMHQREFNVKKPGFDYIWGIGITYSL